MYLDLLQFKNVIPEDTRIRDNFAHSSILKCLRFLSLPGFVICGKMPHLFVKFRNELAHVYFRIYGASVRNDSLKRKGKLIQSTKKETHICTINHLENAQ